MKRLIHHKKLTLILFICFLAQLFYCYELYLRVWPGCIPAILMQQFNLTVVQLGLLFSFYQFGYTIMQLPVGVLMDQYGPKLILTLSCLMCALSTWLFAVTDNYNLLLCARFIMGVGSSFAYIGVLKIVVVFLSTRWIGFFSGVTSALGMLTGIVANYSIAVLGDIYSWQSMARIAALLGIILASAIWLSMHTLLTQQQNYHKLLNNNDASIGTMLIALQKLIINKKVWLISIIGLCCYTPISLLGESWAIVYFSKLGLSQQHTRYAAYAIFLGFMVGAPIWGAAANYVKNRLNLLLLGSSMSLFSWLLALCCQDILSYSLWWWMIFMTSFSASCQVLVFMLVAFEIADEFSATAMAFTNTVISLGGMLLVPCIGLLLQYTDNNYQITFLVLPCSLLIAIIATGYLQLLNNSRFSSRLQATIL